MTSGALFQVRVFRRTEERSGRPEHDLEEGCPGPASARRRLRRCAARDTARSASPASRRRSSRRTRPAGAMPRCAAMARCGACSVAPAHCTHAVDVVPGSAAVATSRRQLALAAPHRHLHVVLVGRGLLHLAESGDQVPVDGEQQVPRLQHAWPLASRRPGARSSAPGGAPGLCCAMRCGQLSEQAQLARAPPAASGTAPPRASAAACRCARGRACRRPRRSARRGSPARSRGRSRRRSSTTVPSTAPAASLQHAVEVQRRVHQLRRLEVAVAEAHGARQRQLELDRRWRSRCCARCSSPSPPRPTTQMRSPAMSSRGDEPRGLHRRAADQLRVVGDDGEVVQRMHVHHPARHLHGAGEGDVTSPDGDRHGVAVHDHQAALRHPPPGRCRGSCAR